MSFARKKQVRLKPNTIHSKNILVFTLEHKCKVKKPERIRKQLPVSSFINSLMSQLQFYGIKRA